MEWLLAVIVGLGLVGLVVQAVASAYRAGYTKGKEVGERLAFIKWQR